MRSETRESNWVVLFFTQPVEWRENLGAGRLLRDGCAWTGRPRRPVVLVQARRRHLEEMGLFAPTA